MFLFEHLITVKEYSISLAYSKGELNRFSIIIYLKSNFIF